MSFLYLSSPVNSYIKIWKWIVCVRKKRVFNSYYLNRQSCEELMDCFALFANKITTQKHGTTITVKYLLKHYNLLHILQNNNFSFFNFRFFRFLCSSTGSLHVQRKSRMTFIRGNICHEIKIILTIVFNTVYIKHLHIFIKYNIYVSLHIIIHTGISLVYKGISCIWNKPTFFILVSPLAQSSVKQWRIIKHTATIYTWKILFNFALYVGCPESSRTLPIKRATCMLDSRNFA